MKVTNYYDKELQKITGCSFQSVVISQGIIFLFYLYFIFSSYPKIEELYPPGVLGFSVNGKRPNDFTELKDGDNIYFFVNKFLIF